MDEDPRSERSHHRHLEQTRDQVIELLSRQAVEMELVSRSQQASHDVVSQLVVRQQQVALEQRLLHLHPADIAFALESLPPEARARAWALLRPERRAAVLLETSVAVRRALILEMPPEAIASLVRPLAPEDAAELIGELAEPARQSVLERLELDEQVGVRSMLAFPEGSVGAAMDLDSVCVPEHSTLAAVQDALRRRKELPPHTTQLFAVDGGNRLRGLLPISRLLLGDPHSRVADAMTLQPIFFYTDDPLLDAVSAFEKYDLVSAPVLNLHDQIVGRLTVDAVLDAVRERAQTEGLRQVGLSREDEDRFAPLSRAARRRWPWLAINLCTAFVASRVIGAFSSVIQELVALAALMPIVASVGGNAGNQSVALVLQGLSQGAPPLQLRRFLLREIGIGVLNGAVWGSLLGAVALAIYRDLPLACVLAIALALNLVVAASIGVLSPTLLQRCGRDPAMGSSIILTAATDSLGFLIFLGLAALFLR